MKEMTTKKIGEKDSGFQGSVFKNGKNIMIAIRGSDSYFKPDHLLSDWLDTNLLIGIAVLPESVVCALWLYDKVIKEYPCPTYKINVTGHSMGAALAQYIALYAGPYKINKVITWNGLGVIKPTETIVWDYFRNEYFDKIKKNFNPVNGTYNDVINYNISKDIVGSLRYKIGKVFSPDTCSQNNTALLETKKDLMKLTMELLKDTPLWKSLHGEPISEKKVKLYLISKIIFIKTTIGSLAVSEIKTRYVSKLLEFKKELDKKGFSSSSYHQLNNFMPFFDGNGNINRDGKLSNNFLMNSFKDSFKNIVITNEKNQPVSTNSSAINLNTIYIPKILKGEKNKKMGEDLYNTTIGSKNNLYHHLIKKSFNINNTNWYTPEVPEVGKFNNIDYIAGVSGGVPYLLGGSTSKKTASILKISNGNFVISKNV